MSAEYKVGTPADIYYAGTKVRGLRVPGGWSLETDWASFVRDDVVTEVRPLVVLDLVNAPDTARTLRRLVPGLGMFTAGKLAELADQIEAQSRPPKPPEPQGLGAVVEDTEGEVWVRNCPADCEDGGLCIPWHRAKDASTATYDEFDAVRVLSDGWEPKP